MQENSENKSTEKEKIASPLESISSFLMELFDFREDTDHTATIDAIKADIPFKGATAWILIFAVFVASIGLNADSTAVVIGAMLISPLMGPILGLGMSFALNDIDTFKKSLSNLGIMIGLSLFASFMFFYFFPLSEDTSELLGRVSPDIRDVLIAFFGGLALMVARTKKGTIASVIFGVAIATALMPPLCTAGYGLAKGNFPYFFGALYLFTINTIFIALAAFIVLKMLNFPMHKYANTAKRKRYATIATIVGVAVMIPAIFTFLTVFKESQIKLQVNSFVKNEIKAIDNFQLIENSYDANEKILKLSFFNEVTEGERNLLKNQLNKQEYSKIKDFAIKIKGSDTKTFDLISSAYKENREELQQSKNIIDGLQKEITDLKETISTLNNRIEQDALNKNQNVVAFSSIAKDAKIRYSDIEAIGFASVLSSKDFIKIDTIPVATIKWNLRLPDSIISPKERELRSWLQSEMKLDTLFIKRE
ncbi:TIGR00341 family protein [Polaribacter vadi]|uniref:TIGR00341 family protein n=1 Tax=Polaribacter TaxID=52959 RepID=UPI001C08B742|nr:MULTISPECIES: TIGR00341 family protein [Polaribacter]MBU3009922.1 TIGR00341 family protein [Polaribacter vadi]MDO6739728.1 TIGR00341 family protein [Polaribacter sp. 1_MG-2023]